MVARHRRGLAALLAALAVLLVASPGMAASSSGREVIVAAHAMRAVASSNALTFTPSGSILVFSPTKRPLLRKWKAAKHRYGSPRERF